jgi:hypothetical protein
VKRGTSVVAGSGAGTNVVAGSGAMMINSG